MLWTALLQVTPLFRTSHFNAWPHGMFFFDSSTSLEEFEVRSGAKLRELLRESKHCLVNSSLIAAAEKRFLATGFFLFFFLCVFLPKWEV